MKFFVACSAKLFAVHGFHYHLLDDQFFRLSVWLPHRDLGASVLPLLGAVPFYAQALSLEVSVDCFLLLAVSSKQHYPKYTF